MARYADCDFKPNNYDVDRYNKDKENGTLEQNKWEFGGKYTLYSNCDKCSYRENSIASGNYGNYLKDLESTYWLCGDC